MEGVPSGNLIQMLEASNCLTDCFFASFMLFIVLCLFITKKSQLISNDQQIHWTNPETVQQDNVQMKTLILC